MTIVTVPKYMFNYVILFNSIIFIQKSENESALFVEVKVEVPRKLK